MKSKTKTTNAANPRRPGATRPRGLRIVATNPQYGRICERAVGQTAASRPVRVFSFPSMAEVRLRPSGGATLFVSRLSDLAGLPASTSVRNANSRQLIFLERLPVAALAARMVKLNIRNAERLHIAAEPDEPAIQMMIRRLIRGLTANDKGANAGDARIVDAWMEGDQLVLLSPQFVRLEVPLKKLGKLIGDDSHQAGSFQIDDDGRFIYWPHADVHLGWTQLRQLVDPATAIEAVRRTQIFNVRYGEAIRAVRERHGLKQSEVAGLTERHLRRIEHGEQAASKNSLATLAAAHEMDLAAYLDTLAAEMKRNR
ncbi:MAG: helix-turn-helix transcriptional regulator [Planctomycetales bacterium]|nr:helix-turn-helix transcriptional regulator [Planctomycetales bacterium]